MCFINISEQSERVSSWSKRFVTLVSVGCVNHWTIIFTSELLTSKQLWCHFFHRSTLAWISAASSAAKSLSPADFSFSGDQRFDEGLTLETVSALLSLHWRNLALITSIFTTFWDIVIPCLKMAWHGDTQLGTVTLSLSDRVSSCQFLFHLLRAACNIAFKFCHLPKREKKRKWLGQRKELQ